MATVWVVEEGEYSDYHVVGVFSSKAHADRIQMLCGGSVAEWEMDPSIEQLNAGLWPYSICMAMDGTTERISRCDSVSSYSLGNGLGLWERTKAPRYRDVEGTQDAIMGTVWAESDAHAVKITNEHRIAYIANGVMPQ